MPFVHRCKILRVQFHLVRVTEYSFSVSRSKSEKNFLEWNLDVVNERRWNVVRTKSKQILVEHQHLWKQMGEKRWYTMQERNGQMEKKNNEWIAVYRDYKDDQNMERKNEPRSSPTVLLWWRSSSHLLLLCGSVAYKCVERQKNATKTTPIKLLLEHEHDRHTSSHVRVCVMHGCYLSLSLLITRIFQTFFMFVCSFMCVCACLYMRLISVRPSKFSFTILSLSSRRYDTFQSEPALRLLLLLLSHSYYSCFSNNFGSSAVCVCVLFAFICVHALFSSCSPVWDAAAFCVVLEIYSIWNSVLLLRFVDFPTNEKEQNFTVTVWM